MLKVTGEVWGKIQTQLNAVLPLFYAVLHSALMFSSGLKFFLQLRDQPAECVCMVEVICLLDEKVSHNRKLQMN